MCHFFKCEGDIIMIRKSLSLWSLIVIFSSNIVFPMDYSRSRNNSVQDPDAEISSSESDSDSKFQDSRRRCSRFNRILYEQALGCAYKQVLQKYPDFANWTEDKKEAVISEETDRIYEHLIFSAIDMSKQTESGLPQYKEKKKRKNKGKEKVDSRSRLASTNTCAHNSHRACGETRTSSSLHEQEHAQTSSQATTNSQGASHSSNYSMGPDELRRNGDNVVRIQHDFRGEREEFERTERETFILRKHNFSPEMMDLSMKDASGDLQLLIARIKRCTKVAAILNGTTGSGKSVLAESIAQKFNIPYEKIDSGTVKGTYESSLQRNSTALFQMATRQTGRFMLIFEEIDRLLLPASDREDQRAPSSMQTRLDELKNEYPLIVILGTSNYAHKLSPELKRRYKIIDIPHPEKDRCKEMIYCHLKENFPGKTFTDAHLDNLYYTLAGRSLSLIAEAIEDAKAQLDTSENSAHTSTAQSSAQGSSARSTTNTAAQATTIPVINASEDRIIKTIKDAIPGYYREQLKSVKSGASDYARTHGTQIATGAGAIALGAGIIAGVGKMIGKNKEEEKKKNEEELRKQAEETRKKEQQEFLREHNRRERERQEILKQQEKQKKEQHEREMYELQRKKELDQADDMKRLYEEQHWFLRKLPRAIGFGKYWFRFRIGDLNAENKKTYDLVDEMKSARRSKIEADFQAAKGSGCGAAEEQSAPLQAQQASSFSRADDFNTPHLDRYVAASRANFRANLQQESFSSRADNFFSTPSLDQCVAACRENRMSDFMSMRAETISRAFK